MNDQEKNAQLERIVDSAKRMGIELDENEALQWLTAIALANEGDDISVDIRSGVFGHKVTMLDFNPEELAHFRRIGALVEFEDIPGEVETALALSGSAAQSKIQKSRVMRIILSASISLRPRKKMPAQYWRA
jgi:hypothetical protein